MIEPSPIQALFAYFDEIQHISEEAKTQLTSIAFTIEAKKNQVIKGIGQTCRTYYFVSQGLARIHYLKDGIDVTEYFAGKNDMIIRAESLFTGKPSQKAIQVLEDSLLIGIPAEALEVLFDQYSEIERLFRKVTENSFVAYVNRMESLQFYSAEERYTQLLQAYPQYIQRIPLKHIASYLGITPVSLSRIRAALK